MKRYPSLSIVIEWENAKNSDAARAKAMLTALFQQVQRLSNAFAAPPEALLVHDEDEALAETLLKDLHEELALFPGAVRTVWSRNADYYDQKNLGAAAATNEAVLLVDSDVIPEHTWLEALLDCYVEEHADVACGATHMTRRTIYDKSFAAFWFFPLPSDLHGRREVETFFANNVIFNTDLLKAHPFPTGNVVRGKCVQLAQTLRSHGYKVVVEPRARVEHPPPNGAAHFVKRALCAGQDNVVLHTPRGAIPAARRFSWGLKYAWKRISRHRKEVDLSPPGVVAAFCIAGAYRALEFLGEIVTLTFPGVIARHIRV